MQMYKSYPFYNNLVIQDWWGGTVAVEQSYPADTLEAQTHGKITLDKILL